MTPNRPYLLRALNEWIVDNDMTPHILVDAEAEAVEVPNQYVQDGRIVLNISPDAVQNLFVDNEAVSFNARFGGTPYQIYVPMNAILAIYARETGKGMIFPEEEETENGDTPGGGSDADEKKKPHLKVIK